jgi:hypothetical protein
MLIFIGKRQRRKHREEGTEGRNVGGETVRKRQRGTDIGKETEGKRQERKERGSKRESESERGKGKVMKERGAAVVFTSLRGQWCKIFKIKLFPLGPTGPKGRQLQTNLKF